MSKFIHILFNGFGNLFDIAPQEKKRTQKLFFEIENIIEKRKNQDIGVYFDHVGSYFNNSIKSIRHEK